jgi:hypothetical protein
LLRFPSPGEIKREAFGTADIRRIANGWFISELKAIVVVKRKSFSTIGQGILGDAYS